MLKVFKYPIQINDYFTLELPYAARILKVECQNLQPCLWALVNPDNSIVKRVFRFAGTGHPIAHDFDDLKHVSTFQMDGGHLIFHIFEVLPGGK
jgi:hypothetical protein